MPVQIVGIYLICIVPIARMMYNINNTVIPRLTSDPANEFSG
jgi:hypothetical protein